MCSLIPIFLVQPPEVNIAKDSPRLLCAK